MSVYGSSTSSCPRWCRRTHCAVPGCERHVRVLLCAAHLRMVPAALQRVIVQTSAPAIAIARALNAVAMREHRPLRHWFGEVDLLHAPGVCAVPASPRLPILKVATTEVAPSRPRAVVTDNERNEVPDRLAIPMASTRPAAVPPQCGLPLDSSAAGLSYLGDPLLTREGARSQAALLPLLETAEVFS